MARLPFGHALQNSYHFLASWEKLTFMPDFKTHSTVFSLTSNYCIEPVFCLSAYKFLCKHELWLFSFTYLYFIFQVRPKTRIRCVVPLTVKLEGLSLKRWTKRWTQIIGVDILSGDKYETYEYNDDGGFPEPIKRQALQRDPTSFPKEFTDYLKDFDLLTSLQLCRKKEDGGEYGYNPMPVKDKKLKMDGVLYQFIKAFRNKFTNSFGKTVMCYLMRDIFAKLGIWSCSTLVLGDDKNQTCRHVNFQLNFEREEPQRQPLIADQCATCMAVPDVLVFKVEQDEVPSHSHEVPFLVVSVESKKTNGKCQALINSLISYVSEVQEIWGLEIGMTGANIFYLKRYGHRLDLYSVPRFGFWLPIEDEEGGVRDLLSSDDIKRLVQFLAQIVAQYGQWTHDYSDLLRSSHKIIFQCKIVLWFSLVYKKYLCFNLQAG